MQRERESIKDKFAQMSGKFKFPNVGKIEENCEPIGDIKVLLANRVRTQHHNNHFYEREK